MRATIWLAAMTSLLMAAPVAGPAQSLRGGAEAVRAPVVTRHAGTFNGQRIAYRAEMSETPIRDEAGNVSARLVSIAYVAEEAGDPNRRPVLFVFNGGPISASVYLHMGAFGPRRIAFPDDLAADTTTLPLVDNNDTVLDVADIVFFDPAGTGFSRVADGVPPERFFSVVADGRQMTDFIAEWLRARDRLDSPVYLFGESYGTMRAAQVARQLVDLPRPIRPAGVILFGQALNIVEFSQRPGNIISYAVSLPTLAALAWYHGRVDRAGRTLDGFLDEARAFAADDYLRALYAGSRLDEAEKARVAGRLAEISGISAEYYLANNLRITKEQYRRELFREQGLILGRNDGRYAGPPTGQGGGDPSNVVAEAYQRGFMEHLRTTLGVDWEEEYRFYTGPGGLDGWNWGATSPFSDWPYMNLISQVMERVPDFRVLIAVGIYDTSTTTGASEYALAQSGWPADRSGIVYYGGGHMAYSDEASFRQMMRDTRAFVRPRD
jgi:carboxypeptidase C (cathepsin A)